MAGDDRTAKLLPMSDAMAERDATRARWFGLACAVAVLAIWTSFILVARGSAVRTLSPFDIAWLRFAFSGLVVLPIVVWRWRALMRGLGAEPRTVAARGVLLTLTAGIGYCGLAYSGFFFAPAAHAAVLMPGSLPLWTALFAVALLAEKLSAARVAGLALIVAGDLLVGGASLLAAFQGGTTWRGDVLFLFAGMCWSLYGVLCRRWRVGAVDATLAVALGCLVSAVPAYGIAVGAGVVDSRLTAAPWGEIAFQAVYQGGLAMLVAGYAFTQVVATFGPVKTTMMTAVVPPLSALAAVPVLGEPLGAAALGGLACVTLGLLLGVGLVRWPARAAVAR
jgi:drug/metabolite transporter (DMT)-like permease